MTDVRTVLCDLRLSDRRRLHTMGVIEAAEELAKRHFPEQDTEKARLAAAMHDFTKELSFQEQLGLCEKYGISLEPEELRSPKLLHSKTAAAIAREVYGLDEEICSAVYWHTTGRSNMTALETVVYFADYIEKYREDEGCILVRESYESLLETEKGIDTALYKALVLSFDMTIHHLIEQKKIINRYAVDARNYYLSLYS